MSIALHFISHSNAPELSFIQYLRVHKSYESISFNISVSNSENPTFFNICEDSTTYYRIEPDYDNKRYVVSKKNLEDDFPYVDFVLKGSFVNTTVEITPEYHSSTKKIFIPFGFLIIIAFSAFIIKINVYRKYKLAIAILFILLYVYSVSISGIGVYKDQKFEILNKGFPLTSSIFETKTMKKFVKKLLKFTPLDENSCQSCRIDKFHEPESDSSIKDLVVTVCLNSGHNVEPFIRSLRTVHSKATLVIFTNLREFVGRFQECGANVIYVENGHNLRGEFFEQAFAYKIISQFLNIIPKKSFNRVFFSNLHTTHFQGDPFLKNITDNTIVVDFEKNLIGEGDKIFNNNEMRTLNTEYINQKRNTSSFFFIASENVARIVFNAVANWMPYDINDMKVPVQAYFLNCLYSGFFEANGIEVRSYLPKGMYPTETSALYPIHFIDNKDYPITVIHQSNKNERYYYSMQFLCHRD